MTYQNLNSSYRYIKTTVFLNLLFETQPLEQRTVKLYRTKLHNEKPEHFQIVRKQFPVRLTYSMTINKAQGTKFCS